MLLRLPGIFAPFCPPPALRAGDALPEAPEGYRCQVNQTEDGGLSAAEIEIFWGDTPLYTLETSWVSGLSGEEVAQP